MPLATTSGLRQTLLRQVIMVLPARGDMSVIHAVHICMQPSSTTKRLRLNCCADGILLAEGNLCTRLLDACCMVAVVDLGHSPNWYRVW